MIVNFHHVTHESPQIATFYFSATKLLEYQAGQYVELTLQEPAGKSVSHWFTLSSSPSQPLLSITTRIGKTPSEYKRILLSLKPEDSADMSDALGDFVLPLDQARPLVFVAGGIGITPFMSILRWMSDNEDRRKVKMIHAVHSEDDIIFQDELRQAKQHVTIVVEKPSPPWSGERGHLTAEMIIGLEQPSPDTLIYLAGPEPMVEALRLDLLSSGINSNQIVIDAFLGYTSI